MEKYCNSCGAVFNDLKFKICPHCGNELDTRYGRQPIPRQLRHEVFKRDGYRCRECGSSKDETSLEIDHIIPVVKGGTNDIDNLQTLCRECNRMKHTDEWEGGEIDLEIAQNELSVLKEQLNRSKKKLRGLIDEDEIIKCKFNIIKLKESIAEVKQKISKLKQEKIKMQQEQKKKEKKEKLYMKLYVELDEKSLSIISDCLKYNSILDEEYQDKDEFLWYLINNYSYDEIMDIRKKRIVKKINNKTEKKRQIKKNRQIKNKPKQIKGILSSEKQICSHCGKKISIHAYVCPHCLNFIKKIE